jgi:hypothetical protein
VREDCTHTVRGPTAASETESKRRGSIGPAAAGEASRRLGHGPAPVRAIWFGGVAEWLGRGLQSPAHRFDSGPRLEAIAEDRLQGQGA